MTSVHRLDEGVYDVAWPKPVFRLELPLELAQGTTKAGKPKKPLPLCPTLNVYQSMPGWLKAKARAEVDQRIRNELLTCAPNEKLPFSWPHATHLGFGRRRVVVTRHSSREPDELSVDVIGGKIPIDRLVKFGILAGDSRRWLEREARWEYARPGAGFLTVEVFDV